MHINILYFEYFLYVIFKSLFHIFFYFFGQKHKIIYLEYLYNKQKIYIIKLLNQKISLSKNIFLQPKISQ